ncbi:MAG TPA: SGNH/GDSL hydrolase family protein [Phnomibacter sp.]|nr:SGNH/GDSL hydrolase family protein [Phnomibacter sp.]
MRLLYDRYSFKCRLLLIAGFLFTCKAHAGDTLRVHFIGNSYTYFYNLTHLISLLSDSLPKKLICTKSVAGGASLTDHIKGQRKLKTIPTLNRFKYDLVVLQDHSLRPLLHPDSMLHDGNILCSMLKAKGARILLYNTWARKDNPQLQDSIDLAYRNLAATCYADVVPAGKIWAYAKQLYPAIELYDADGSHPSQLGTYLNALLFVHVIAGKLPARLPVEYFYPDRDGEQVRLIHISETDRYLCKNIVESYFQRQ